MAMLNNHRVYNIIYSILYCKQSIHLLPRSHLSIQLQKTDTPSNVRSAKLLDAGYFAKVETHLVEF